jgi:hypothetical protein
MPTLIAAMKELKERREAKEKIKIHNVEWDLDGQFIGSSMEPAVLKKLSQYVDTRLQDYSSIYGTTPAINTPGLHNVAPTLDSFKCLNMPPSGAIPRDLNTSDEHVCSESDPVNDSHVFGRTEKGIMMSGPSAVKFAQEDTAQEMKNYIESKKQEIPSDVHVFAGTIDEKQGLVETFMDNDITLAPWVDPIEDERINAIAETSNHGITIKDCIIKEDVKQAMEVTRDFLITEEANTEEQLLDDENVVYTDESQIKQNHLRGMQIEHLVVQKKDSKSLPKFVFDQTLAAGCSDITVTNALITGPFAIPHRREDAICGDFAFSATERTNNPFSSFERPNPEDPDVQVYSHGALANVTNRVRDSFVRDIEHTCFRVAVPHVQKQDKEVSYVTTYTIEHLSRKIKARIITTPFDFPMKNDIWYDLCDNDGNHANENIVQQIMKANLCIIMKNRAEHFEFKDSESIALDTLREMIPEQDFRHYLKYGFILVKGASGKLYQIFRSKSHAKVWDHGILVEEVCIRINEKDVPLTDNVIAFKIMIETSEELFKSKGNVYKMNNKMAA